MAFEKLVNLDLRIHICKMGLVTEHSARLLRGLTVEVKHLDGAWALSYCDKKAGASSVCHLVLILTVVHLQQEPLSPDRAMSAHGTLTEPGVKHFFCAALESGETEQTRNPTDVIELGRLPLEGSF